MRKLRWAVCGAAGMAGRKIVRDGLCASGNCRLVAVHSIDEKSASEEGDRYGVPWFVSVEEMISESECDAVYIATPQYVHVEQVKIAASYGKHILCEKPLGTTLDAAVEIVDICGRAGVLLGTDFNYRFHPLHQKMLELVAAGAIGEVVSGRCQFGQDFPPRDGAFRQNLRLSGGGAFADTGNHAADLLEHIMGRRTQSVTALRKNAIHSYDPEDSCAVLLEFEGNGFGIVDAYFCCPIDTLRNDVEINGTKGTLHTRNTLQMETTGSLIIRTAGNTEVLECPRTDMYKTVFERFTEAALNGGEIPATGADGLHSQRIIEAVYKSSDTGRKIEID